MKNDVYTLKQLTTMVKRWNKLNPTRKIKVGRKKDMYISLMRGGARDASTCTTVECSRKFKVIDYPEVKTDASVRKKGGWLSTLDINNVMEYYENRYPTFKYLGTVPIDFQTVYPEIYNPRLVNGYKYALTLNSDDSRGTGSHWFSIVIDTLEKSICIFDSNAEPTMREVKQFIKHINKAGDYTVFINKKQHQFTDGPCGLFAMNFIIERVIGNKSCNVLFLDNEINDSAMEKLRCKIFK